MPRRTITIPKEVYDAIEDIRASRRPIPAFQDVTIELIKEGLEKYAKKMSVQS